MREAEMPETPRHHPKPAPRLRHLRALRPLKTIAKPVLALALLGLPVLAVRHLNLGVVGATMLALPHSALLLALLVSIGQVLALATRLWAVFPDSGRPGWGHVARAFGFGQLANACLPGRAGDVLKVVAMSRPGPVGGTSGAAIARRATSPEDATGVMLADKALDFTTLAVLVLVFAPALLAGFLIGAMHLMWVAPVAALLVVVVALVVRRYLPMLWAKVRSGATATGAALRGLATPKRMASGVALGCGAWLAEAGSMLVLACPMGVHLTIAQAMVGLLVLNLGIAVPVSVANAGAYEAATVVGLAPFGVPPAQALALGALHHLVQLVAIGGFALAFWLRDRLARRLAGRAARRQTAPGRLIAPRLAVGLLPPSARAVCEAGTTP